MPSDPSVSNYATWEPEKIDIALAALVYGVQDAQIDEMRNEVFGWSGDPGAGTVVNMHGPRPTQSLQAAFDLITAMQKRPVRWWCRIFSPIPGTESTKWAAAFSPAGVTWDACLQAADTPTLAISLSALCAITEEKPLAEKIERARSGQ